MRISTEELANVASTGGESNCMHREKVKTPGCRENFCLYTTTVIRFHRLYNKIRKGAQDRIIQDYVRGHCLLLLLVLLLLFPVLFLVAILFVVEPNSADELQLLLHPVSLRGFTMSGTK